MSRTGHTINFQNYDFRLDFKISFCILQHVRHIDNYAIKLSLKSNLRNQMFSSFNSFLVVSDRLL